MAGTRKIAAILVADIVGYSRLAGADEDRTLSRLRGLRSDLIDPAIDAHHGRIVKRTDDGSLIEFRSVGDAVRCAIEVQNGLVERNAGLPPERRIEFRVGIHLGEVVEESDSDLMGGGVNIAARLEGICEPGGVCLSSAAHEQVRDKLKEEFVDLGEKELKNIARPVRAYRVALDRSAVKSEPLPKRRSALALLAVGIVVLLIVIADRTAPVASIAAAATEAARLSIVVLPFANLSGDPAQDYLADVLTDELTTDLGRIPNSFVIARNTAFTYKGKPVDAKAVGKDLGVRYVLEGSVQPSTAQVRVNAQLIDADSGAHLWAEQFDTARADLLQMQDEIVTHLARALEFQFPEIEAARLKRTPPANPNAEDLALQCTAAIQKGGFIGSEAEATFRLCEQALDVDPNNVRALSYLSLKFWLPVGLGRSADPKGDLKRGDDLVSQALALDPNYAPAHTFKAGILELQTRYDEAIAEDERALALDPAIVDADAHLGWTYLRLGQFEKSLEYFDKAIRLSPYDPGLGIWFSGDTAAYFGLKQYDEAIGLARRALAINPNNVFAHGDLIAAFALTGRELEAREALQQYLALPPAGIRTIAAFKAFFARVSNPHSDPRILEGWDRTIEGLRKAGMPEE
jgi:adenylate cyclase